MKKVLFCESSGSLNLPIHDQAFLGLLDWSKFLYSQICVKMFGETLILWVSAPHVSCESPTCFHLKIKTYTTGDIIPMHSADVFFYFHTSALFTQSWQWKSDLWKSLKCPAYLLVLPGKFSTYLISSPWYLPAKVLMISFITSVSEFLIIFYSTLCAVLAVLWAITAFWKANCQQRSEIWQLKLWLFLLLHSPMASLPFFFASPNFSDENKYCSYSLYKHPLRSSVA